MSSLYERRYTSNGSDNQPRTEVICADRHMEENCLWEFFLGEIMKIRMLVIYVVGLSLIGITCADGLPKMGYTSGRSVKDLVAKGYRWVTVDGPYACAKEQEVRQITSRRTDLTELSLVEAGDAY
jgi:hypothetical protein